MGHEEAMCEVTKAFWQSAFLFPLIEEVVIHTSR